MIVRTPKSGYEGPGQMTVKGHSWRHDRAAGV